MVDFKPRFQCGNHCILAVGGRACDRPGVYRLQATGYSFAASRSV